MKIVNEGGDKMWSPLEAFVSGTPVYFKQVFHPKFTENDIFIINSLCSTYMPEDDRYRLKIPITCLRNGELSYVDCARSCRAVKCQVVVDRDDW